MGTAVIFGDTASKYGGALARPSQATRDDSQLPAVAGPSPSSQTAAYHPGSGLFWFGVIAAAAVGLAYASTTVRVGPASASVSLGKS